MTVQTAVPERAQLREPAGRSETGRALGSPTRAAIYDHLRGGGAALTVRDVAAAFDLHPNVARTHLGVLADAGLVTVGRRKHPGGGRPAKLYRAREDVDTQAQLDGAVAGGGPAAALLVRLLVGLLDAEAADERVAAAAHSGRADATLAGRAHHAAVAEGRRLLLPAAPQPSDSLEASVSLALRALRPYAPDLRVARAGRDWVEVTGAAASVHLVERVDPVLAEAIERGLLAGACAAAGGAVTVVDASAGNAAPRPAPGRGWRLERSTTGASRPAVAAAALLDARGLPREAGVVAAMRSITRLAPGDVLEVLAEGPGSPAAFARWADRAGHQLLAVERATDATGRPAIRLLLRKGR